MFSVKTRREREKEWREQLMGLFIESNVHNTIYLSTFFSIADVPVIF